MRKKQVDFYNEKDILDQEKQNKAKGFRAEKKEEENQALEHEKPSIKTRYFSTLLDAGVIVIISLTLSALFNKYGEVPEYIRGITFLVVFILYEPILVSQACTIGQLLTGIRVRKLHKPNKRIGIIAALLRTFTKALLGWVSLLVISFNKNQRALHDYIVGSVVIEIGEK